MLLLTFFTFFFAGMFFYWVTYGLPQKRVRDALTASAQPDAIVEKKLAA